MVEDGAKLFKAGWNFKLFRYMVNGQTVTPPEHLTGYREITEWNRKQLILGGRGTSLWLERPFQVINFSNYVVVNFEGFRDDESWNDGADMTGLNHEVRFEIAPFADDGDEVPEEQLQKIPDSSAFANAFLPGMLPRHATLEAQFWYDEFIVVNPQAPIG